MKSSFVASEIVLDEAQAVCYELAAALEIAHQVLVALLGNLRGRRDVDDEGHLPLFADLRNCKCDAAVERSDKAIYAIIDRPLRLRPRHIC